MNCNSSTGRPANAAVNLIGSCLATTLFFSTDDTFVTEKLDQGAQNRPSCTIVFGASHAIKPIITTAAAAKQISGRVKTVFEAIGLGSAVSWMLAASVANRLSIAGCAVSFDFSRSSSQLVNVDTRCSRAGKVESTRSAAEMRRSFCFFPRRQKARPQIAVANNETAVSAKRSEWLNRFN